MINSFSIIEIKFAICTDFTSFKIFITASEQLNSLLDTIVYELHVRDFSVKEGLTFPADHVGKFLAFTDKGVTTATGEKAGIDKK